MPTNMVRKTIEGVMITISDTFGPILPSRVINKDIIFAPNDLALRLRAEHTEKGFRMNAESKVETADKYTLDFVNVWMTDIQFSWERQRTGMFSSRERFYSIREISEISFCRFSMLRL